MMRKGSPDRESTRRANSPLRPDETPIVCKCLTNKLKDEEAEYEVKNR